jgi:hypothetical protein
LEAWSCFLLFWSSPQTAAKMGRANSPFTLSANRLRRSSARIIPIAICLTPAPHLDPWPRRLSLRSTAMKSSSEQLPHSKMICFLYYILSIFIPSTFLWPLNWFWRQRNS